MIVLDRSTQKSQDEIRTALKEDFVTTRNHTLLLSEPLTDEDQVIQTMPDVSPMKWHLAHTSWFFETFLLKPYQPSYKEKDRAYNYLFNSYYEQIGQQWPRAKRGLLSRPTLAEVRDYRSHVDNALMRLMNDVPSKIWEQIHPLITLGIQHEKQHQELMLTDIKHVMSMNPFKTSVYKAPYMNYKNTKDDIATKWLSFEKTIFNIGCSENTEGFYFDNETPKHEKLISSFSLSETLVTNHDFMAFIEDGGYSNPLFWLSDGWAHKQTNDWQHPLYWRQDENEGWVEFTLSGEIPIQPESPVVHVSYYEANAYANWANKRLPREEEIEQAALDVPIEGNLGLMVKDNLAQAVHPIPAQGDGLRQIYGDVWEWTESPYAAYPGYSAAKTAIGEYNGKFMCNQFVLKGGSCATPKEHIRPTYRNFFPPEARWQFSGIRLASDLN